MRTCTSTAPASRSMRMRARWVLPRTIESSTTTSRLPRSEEHTSELQSRQYLVCRLLLEKKKKNTAIEHPDTQSAHILYILFCYYLKFERADHSQWLCTYVVPRPSEHNSRHVVPRCIYTG